MPKGDISSQFHSKPGLVEAPPTIAPPSCPRGPLLFIQQPIATDRSLTTHRNRSGPFLRLPFNALLCLCPVCLPACLSLNDFYPPHPDNHLRNPIRRSAHYLTLNWVPDRCPSNFSPELRTSTTGVRIRKVKWTLEGVFVGDKRKSIRPGTTHLNICIIQIYVLSHSGDCLPHIIWLPRAANGADTYIRGSSIRPRPRYSHCH